MKQSADFILFSPDVMKFHLGQHAVDESRGDHVKEDHELPLEGEDGLAPPRAGHAHERLRDRLGGVPLQPHAFLPLARVEGAIEKLGLGRRRADEPDRHPRPDYLRPERVRHPVEGELARSVRGVVRGPALSDDRRDDQDPSASAVAHPWKERADRPQHAEVVHLVHLAHRLVGGVLEPGVELDSGVGDDDVRNPVPFEDPPRKRHHRGTTRHVSRHRDDAAGGERLPGEGLESSGVPESPDDIELVRSSDGLLTFNIKFGAHIDRAADLLSRPGPLHDPDLLFVQETDGPGTEALARAL